MIIKILGPGCSKCEELKENIKTALSQMGKNNIEIKSVSGIDEIIEYGVMSTPAVVIDEEVKGAGKVFEVEEVKEWIENG